MCGLRNRLQITEFCDYIFQQDIGCISETKLDNADVDYVTNACRDYGFTINLKNRTKFAKRRSGGLAVVVRNELLPFVTFFKSKSKYVQWFELSNPDKSDSIVFGNIYIPPSGSKFFNENAFEEINDELQQFLGKKTFLLGDFNAYTGVKCEIDRQSEYADGEVIN